MATGGFEDFFNKTKKGAMVATKNAAQYLPEYKDDGFAIPGAYKPQESQQLKTAFDKQYAGAQEYAKNLKSKGDTIFNTYADQARTALPGVIQGVREKFNSRGLLKSGKAKAGEAGAVRDMNESLLSKRAEINQGLLDNLGRMESNVFNTGALMAQPGAQTAGLELQGIGNQLGMANNDTNNTLGVINAIIGGGAAVGGAGLANAMQNQGGGVGNPNAYNMGTQYGVDYKPMTNKYYS